ncbi:MAG: chemotaxis response regulator protein-glutamate methylesterase [Selenomonadaceae bacterium]|nr:chemotaxis response regulator protein-glutamate methylesterase [Selenomonadaceae bacterium]
MIKVLIADDSAFMRKVLTDVFDKQPDFAVVGTANNGQEAVKKTKELKPDIVTMDVNMPVMDGLEALRLIMRECPTPVVMISSLTQQGTTATIKALSLGAVDFISKVGGSVSRIDSIEADILSKCRLAAKARVRAGLNLKNLLSSKFVPPKPVPPSSPVYRRLNWPPPPAKDNKKADSPDKMSSQVVIPGTRRTNPLLTGRAKMSSPSLKTPTASIPSSQKLVAIGTSTGGPQALQNVITRLPGDLPCGVVIVQHMPAGFTKALAERLDSISAIAVKEAEHNDIIKPGQVYLAPGNFHMRIDITGDVKKILLSQDPPVGNHRPAVDVMFDSVAPLGRKLVAVIMTGMGCDGCAGMKKIKQQGGYSIAQDEDTCVVYGMPKAVVDAGLADEVKPVQDIASAIVAAVKR